MFPRRGPMVKDAALGSQRSWVRIPAPPLGPKSDRGGHECCEADFGSRLKILGHPLGQSASFFELHLFRLVPGLKLDFFEKLSQVSRVAEMGPGGVNPLTAAATQIFGMGGLTPPSCTGIRPGGVTPPQPQLLQYGAGLGLGGVNPPHVLLKRWGG